uniref:Ig-like domain-containing protein n=1 Tax=Cyprinus carpio carpio TaxID=630221 RepID=A0A8C1HHD0_CYPCA
MYVNLFIVCVLFYKPCKYNTTTVMVSQVFLEPSLLFIVSLMFQQMSSHYFTAMHYSGSILQMEDVAVQVGDDVTFYCFHPKDQLNRVMWFKQTLGERPVLVASSYHWTQKSVLYDDFEKSIRFRAGAGIGSFNLTIQETAQSDSATYYCAVSFSNVVYFGAGTNLVLRGDNVLQSQIHDISSAGGNVTLLCTIQNEQESCRGDHKVYWFKHGLGKSHSGIIYTQGSCKNSSVSPTKSCVYSLSLRNIKPSDDGTYYCAVVTCKEILFGNGINLVSYGKCYHRTSDLNYAALKFTRQSSRQQREERQRLTEYSGLKCKNSVL